MMAIPVPYTKQSRGEYETVIVKFTGINNYYNYIMGNTKCYNFIDMRCVERKLRKLGTIKKDFIKKMYKENKNPRTWDSFDTELLNELSSVCKSILCLSE